MIQRESSQLFLPSNDISRGTFWGIQRKSFRDAISNRKNWNARCVAHVPGPIYTVFQISYPKKSGCSNQFCCIVLEVNYVKYLLRVPREDNRC